MADKIIITKTVDGGIILYGLSHEGEVMKDPNYAPIYCALYPDIVRIVQKHGYALAVHGSLARDFDLICIPWVESPGEPRDVVEAITSELALRCVGEPHKMFHGREVRTISIGFGECFIDLSFMPKQQKSVADYCRACGRPSDSHICKHCGYPSLNNK